MRRPLAIRCLHTMISLILLSDCGISHAADSLPLSEQQIQTLRAHLPSNEESMPLVWKGDPLPISLALNSEKRLIFPEPVEANLNGSLDNSQLRIINNDQSLYLTALKPFDTTRMYVTLRNSHRIILMDITISEQATQTPQTIRLSSDVTTAANKSLTSAASVHVTTHPYPVTEKNTLTLNPANQYVQAMRFAWQQLYAPERFVTNEGFFTRTPMHTRAWLSTLIYGDKVFVHPLISWVSGDVYVTAIELRNKYASSTFIDVKRDLCGQWQAAALYPRQRLKAAGDKTGDSTTLFLISEKPFGEALEVCRGSA